MFLVRYFYGKKEKSNDLVVVKADKKPEIPVIVKKPKNNVLFLVTHKNSGENAGIFDDFSLAKKNGDTFTYNNCIITKYFINDKCSSIHKIVYESM